MSNSTKKFGDSKLKLTAVILTLVLLPLLYVYLGSLTLTGADPAEKLKKLNASIVNLDLGTTQENNETLNIGDSIEKTLLESEKGFNWAKDTDENLAQEKLENGNYNVVLTIPKDFTKNIVNLPKDASTNIQAEQITLQTNDAINYETGNIAETVSRVIQAEVRSKITSQMSNKILASIGKIKESLVKATDGTGQLAEGSDKLNAGLNKLKSGTDQLSGRIPELTNGTGQLAAGANLLLGGSQKLQNGLQELNTKAPLIPQNLGKVDTNLKTLVTNTQTLAQSTGQVSQGLTQVNNGLNSVLNSPDGNINMLKDSIKTYSGGVDQLVAGKDGLIQASQILKETQALMESTTNKMAVIQQRINDLCQEPDMAGTPRCARLQEHSISQQEIQDLTVAQVKLSRISENLTKVSGGMAQLEGKSVRLNASTEKIVGAIAKIHGATQKLDEGATKISQSTPRLHAGTEKLSQGVSQLYASAQNLPLGIGKIFDGSTQLTGGLETLSAGSNKLNNGVQTLSSRIPELTSGVTQLAEGSGKLNDGTHKLDESLTAGAEKIPGYDSETIEKISTHIAKPIEATTHRINPVKHSGIGTLPYYLALGLWLLSLLVFLLVPALLRDRDDQPNLAKSLGVATGIGIAQGLFVALLTNSLFGLSLPKLGGFIFIITLATVAFTLLNQALIGLFGNKGKLISILALIVQMIATGLTYPMEVLPSFLQGLSAMLPMTYVTDAIRIYTSNAGQSLTLHIAVLVITAIIGVIGTVIAANKAKVAETNYA